MTSRLRRAAPMVLDAVVALAAALTLTYWFWRSLVFTHAGFLGGDIYNYYFPLRKFYAEGLAQGGLFLWHPGIGNGIPVLGESQTGAFYLPYLLAYRFLELGDAYNIVFLGHYVVAFVGAFFLGRQLGLPRVASLLVATIFVFGWFPERACLEWAIVTGSWCPIIVALSLAVLKEANTGAGLALSAAVGTQLLAGHFQLAFVTVVAVGTLGIGRLLVDRNVPACRRLLLTICYLAIGFALAAPQLVPAWMLKSRSQRQEDVFAKSVDFGNVPIWYWSQMFFPEEVYPQSEGLIRNHGATTNLVEAQLYPGRITLALLLLLPFAVGRLRRNDKAKWIDLVPWMLLLTVGLALAEGSVFRILNRLPGFGYFRYPGRYGMLAQLGAAALAGYSLQGLSLATTKEMVRAVIGHLIAAGCLALACWDFHSVRMVRGESQIGYATIVPEAPIRLLERSEVKKLLSPTVRIFSMDGNTLSLLGVSCVPPYLGLGPAEYYEIWGKLPNLFGGEVGPEPAILATLEKMGVTHMLTEKPLPTGWPAQLLWSGYDPFLHVRWGRDPREPLYLYELLSKYDRIYAVDRQGKPLPMVQFIVRTLEPHYIMFSVLPNARAAKIITSELAYPGWYMTFERHIPPVATDVEGIFRAAPAKEGQANYRWRYVDIGMHVGCGIALGTLIALGAVGAIFPRVFQNPGEISQIEA